MKLVSRHIALIFCFLLITVVGNSQNSHEEYLRTNPEQHEFDNKKWEDSRGGMMKEARGLKDDREVKNYDLQPGDVTTENEYQGDYYRYDEEGREGNYSEYDSYDGFENLEQEEYNPEDYDGENYDDPYHPKEYDEEHGENQYHPEEESEPTYYKPKKSKNYGGGGGLGFLQYLLIGVLIALLIFLVYQLFMKTSFDDKGKKVEVALEELAPTEIPKTELEIRLEKALADGNYREAIRIYFIFTIKDLSEKEWIRWEKKKTNISYLIEMRGRPQYDQFNEVVSVFEYAWYGNYPINQSDFQTVEPKFKSLLNSINS